jgi:serine/threonine protein kinase
MKKPQWLDESRYSEVQALWASGDQAVVRAVLLRDGVPKPVLLVGPLSRQPPRQYRDRLNQEYSLKSQLARPWAAEPLELTRISECDVLVLRDPGGELLSQLVADPMEIGDFLLAATAIATAVSEMHQAGLIHKDLKPANILVDRSASQAWLTGFGLASRFPQDCPAASAREIITGSLAYMAPEQTGQVDRSIDARSDLYSLGVTLYEALTGTLPFLESEPQQLIHAHIARNPPNPAERAPGIPEAISAIVLKLLAKNPDERYQSATGLLADLRQCAQNWLASREIPAFQPGKKDVRNRLILRDSLYGRAMELEQLNAAWHRVRTNGLSELILVSGYSGVGKSALVDTLRMKAAVEDCLFVAGKFDQYNRDIPFAPLPCITPLGACGHWRS